MIGPFYVKISHKPRPPPSPLLCENLKYKGPYMLLLLALTAEWLGNTDSSPQVMGSNPSICIASLFLSSIILGHYCVIVY